MLRGHELPLVRIAILEGEPFRVGTIAQDDRIFSIANWSENIGAQDEAVIHRDRHVPVDAHAVPCFRAVFHYSNSRDSTWIPQLNLWAPSEEQTWSSEGTQP